MRIMLRWLLWTPMVQAGPELLSSAAEGLADLLSTLDARVSNRGSRPLHADRLKALQFFDVTSGATEVGLGVCAMRPAVFCTHWTTPLFRVAVW